MHNFRLSHNKISVNSLSLSLIFHALIILIIFLNFSPTIEQQQVIKVNLNFSNNSSTKNHIETNSNNKENPNLTNSIKNSPKNNNDSAIIEPNFDAKYLNNPPPPYPISAKERGIEGKVILEVLVSKDGSPLNVKIFSSSGSELLDQSALETVNNWQFIPAKQFGQTIVATVFVPIEFKLI